MRRLARRISFALCHLARNTIRGALVVVIGCANLQFPLYVLRLLATRLLDRVGQFMGQQLLPLGGGRIEFARAKMDIVAMGKGFGLDAATELVGSGICVDANVVKAAS